MNYKAKVNLGNGAEEMQIKLDESGVKFDSLFESSSCNYSMITEIVFENYMVKILGENLTVVCSHMGQEAEWFYRELGQMYNKKVLQAFEVKTAPLFETKGVYEYETKKGKADIKIFEDSVCILPTNLDGRRIPYAFINKMQKEDYKLSLWLVNGEHYHFSMMGRDFEPFVKKVMDSVREEKEKNRFLAEIATEETRKRAFEGSRRSYLQTLQSIADDKHMYIAVKELTEEELEELLSKFENRQEMTEEEKEALRWSTWLTIPSKDGKKAVVEFLFPEEATATYVFQVNRAWEDFVTILNRGLESSRFGREEIYLSEEDLRKKDNSKMLLERTPALQELRRNYVGKVVHSSPERWEKQLTQVMQLNK